VIENKRGIVNRISYHEVVRNSKNNFIRGLFGLVFELKSVGKHKVEQPGFGEQNMIWWGFVLAFVLSEFIRTDKLGKAEVFEFFFESS